jgi:hypothetical protein
MTDPTTEYQRLRAMALQIIADPTEWKYTIRDPRDFLAPLSGYVDDSWTEWEAVTNATDEQWFVWRDPSEPRGGRLHVDQVAAHNGRIEAKYGCGLDYYTECQPCRFSDDVLAAMAAGRPNDEAERA